MAPKGSQGTTCLCSFPASAAQEWLSLSPLPGALPKAIEFEQGWGGCLTNLNRGGGCLTNLNRVGGVPNKFE